MKTFVEKILDELTKNFGNDFRKVCIVFPTRRACLIFRKKLAESQVKPVFAPGILGIGDFVSKHVKVQVAEEIPLLLALFDAYKKHWPEQDFGKFYPWGQMLINDFDEIDKHLSDPSRIFTNINELRKIEAAFLPDPESLSWIKEFINSFNIEKLTNLQSEFAKNWNRLSQIYSEFNEILDLKGLAYEGKAYREIIQSLKTGSFTSNWDHFIFAGFYGFSRAEEEMIRLLSKNKKTSLLWDSDQYYINNLSHEAGYYFRKSSLFNKNSQWIENNLASSKKHIEITAVPLQSGQAKYAGELLQKLSSQGLLNIHNTAIVLPDENMLFPVLYSLPAELQPINVTMGYPLKQSQYVEILQILHDMHRHSRSDQQGNRIFYHRYITRLFAHPLLSGLVNNQRKEYEHLNFMNAGLISETYEFKESNYYFREITQSKDLFEYIITFLVLIQQNHSNKKEHELHFEDTITEYIRSEVIHLRDQLEGYLEQVPVSTSWYLIKECVSGLKIPFSGEPVKGLQVMGFLETRALDFETIIILGMNEGTLPSTGGARSFIPYSLRKGFGLPTYEDQDASYSYHFYRLLHKAKNIFLLYNSEVNKTGGGEPSRYILQIKHELKKIMGPALELNFKTINTPITPGKPESILIPKNDHIKDYLQKYLLGYDGDSPKSFSSSALATYINCSLQFYFRYIAHLREKEELDDKIELDVFGNIFHLAMENLYKGTNQITAELIDSIVLKADEEVENAIKKEYGIPYLQLEGHDILLAEVIKELVKKILNRDKSETPFNIIQLEGSYESKISINSGDARLMGKFDRVDESNGVTRIVDYKTGKVELKKGDIEELFSNPKFKTLFQLYFYALLYKNNFPEKIIKTGFYVARSIESGVLFPGEGNPVSDEELSLFSKGLQNLLNSIFDQQVPFSQTEDIKRCEYCEYKNICQR